MTSSRPKTFNEKLTKPVLTGTTANVAAIFATLPLWRAYTDMQSPQNTSSYTQHLGKIFTKSGLINVYKASGHMLHMAPLQSAAYLGVSLAVIDNASPSDTPFQKGGKAGTLAAFVESGIVAHKLPKILRTWNSHMAMHPAVNVHTAYRRCYQASLTKNIVANTLTLGFKLQVEAYFEKYTNMNPYLRSPLSGVIGAAGAGMIFAPLVLLETRTHLSPDKSYFQQIKNVKSVPEFWHGSFSRVVQKSAQAGIAFFCIDLIKKLDSDILQTNLRPKL